MIRILNTIFILLLSLLLIPIKSYSQKGKYRFEHLTTEDGLSQNNVNCILQDSKGFLWTGTNDGLNRYDGYNFKVYKFESGNPTSISHNEIQTIFEDKNGILWVGTLGGGLNKFERETESFKSYKADKNNEFSISSNLIMAIYEDKDGSFWIGTNGGGLNKFDRKNENFFQFKYDSTDPGSLSNNNVYSICEDRSGNFWVGTFGGGLNKFDKKTGTFTHYKHNPQNPRSISSDKIYKVYEDNEGIIWIGTYLAGLNKLVSFNEEDGSPEFDLFISYNVFAPNSLGTNIIWSILEDKEGLLWIGTQWGLNICDKEKIIKLFRLDHSDSEALNFSSVYSLYEDKSDILWIGTLGGGLNKLNKDKKHFAYYKTNPGNPNSLNDNTVNCFYELDDSTIWIGTGGGGINVMNINSEEFTGYKYDPKQPRGLTTQIVKQILKDSNGIIWVGTGIGFFKLINNIDDIGGPIFEKFFNDPDDQSSLSNNSITSICEDRFGDLWIGTASGISRLQPEEQIKSSPIFYNYKNNPDDTSSLSDNSINQIFEDKSGEIWIATNGGGLNKFNRDNDGFIHYKHDPNIPSGLASDLVLSIYEDNLGRMWLGTGDGLNKFNRLTKEFTRYSNNDGQAGSIIFGILEDNKGNLWLSTNKGISRFDPRSESFKNYDEKNGLQRGEFRRGAYLKLNSEELLFGGLNGFNMFHPDSIKENTNIPTIVITDFQLNNVSVPVGYDTTTKRSILDKSISESKEIKLNYNDKVISFEFAALDFHIPEKNKYAYMLEGFEENWNYTDAGRRLVTYTNLDPGDYVFKVKGSNNDGYWNEEGASLNIIILPPWWATTWAYIIYVVIIVSIIYFTWKLQLKRIRVKHDYEISKFEGEKMHEVDEMKSRFFANISHEFRTPLTLIFGPAQDVLDKTEDPAIKKSVGIIKRNATRLYGLVNQLLDLSKLEAGRMKLEASEQNLIPLLKGIFLSFSSLAERRKITLKFNTIEERLNVYVDKDKLEKIINNVLSNAFKFTPEGGEIDFTIEKMIKGAEIRIADNGIGISEERIDKIFDRFYQVDSSHTREGEGTGIGLALTKELVELHKGKIKVESTEGEGTTLTVLLPLGKDHLKPEEIVDKDIQEEVPEAGDVMNLISEIENRKGKTDIDVLLETDKPLLLIVEDNSDVRSYIISHLEKVYRVLEAVDGEDGLNQAMNHIPDLIISDVMMPKMDGFELCNKLKTDEKTSHIPIIMLTAKATSKDKIEGYETGADDYIMKPFDAKELKARIKNLIEIRRKLQEKFMRDDYPPKFQNKNLSKLDEKFMKNVLEVIEKHISEEDFTIEEFEGEFAMSRAQIHRKLKALTGKSPSRYIRSIRLSKAKRMIREREGNISEIAYSIGFNSPAYFSKCFKDEFGYSPSELDS